MRLAWAQGEDCNHFAVYDSDDLENESKYIWTPELDHKDRLRFDWDNCSVEDFLQEICDLVNNGNLFKKEPDVRVITFSDEAKLKDYEEEFTKKYKVPLTLTFTQSTTTEIIQKLNDVIGYLNVISGQINRGK
jgi:hypothetical protein